MIDTQEVIGRRSELAGTYSDNELLPPNPAWLEILSFHNSRSITLERIHGAIVAATIAPTVAATIAPCIHPISC